MDRKARITTPSNPLLDIGFPKKGGLDFLGGLVVACANAVIEISGSG